MIHCGESAGPPNESLTPPRLGVSLSMSCNSKGPPCNSRAPSTALGGERADAKPRRITAPGT
eukprot:scaffold306066_cov24-Tisochrysis_lutea.AAC.1